MADNTLREAPAPLKAVQPYVRLAADIERHDPIVAYWVRLFSTSMALKINRNLPECKSFIEDMLKLLESFKQSHKDSEAVCEEPVGQAHVENFVIDLFNRVDTMDRAGTADKTTVRMFYMAALLFESMQVFGPLTEDIAQKAKYAKFKAAYIQKCLRLGETPVPGPFVDPENPEPGAGEHPVQPPQPPTPPKSQPPSQPSSATKRGLDIPEVPSNDPDSNKAAHLGVSDSLPAGGSPAGAKTSTDDSLSPNTHSLDASISSTKFVAINGADLKPEDITKAQKHCKFVISALQYDDIATAVDYLQKALTLLTTGQQ